MLHIGAICEISKAYDMDTGRRTRIDEIADCEAEILRLHRDGSADVWVRNLGEYNVVTSRLRPLR